MANPKEQLKEDVGRIVFGVALLLLWLILGASILSYTPQELPTSFAYHESEKVGNIAGQLGACCAGFCTWCFGAGSYFLLVQLGMALLAYWFGWTKEIFFKTLGGFLMLTAVSGFCAFTISSSSGSPIGPGGCVGALVKFLLDRIFLPFGSYVALTGLFSSGIILVLPLRTVRFLFWTTGLARSVVWFVAPFLRRIYQAKPSGIQLNIFEAQRPVCSIIATNQETTRRLSSIAYTEQTPLYSSAGFEIVQSSPSVQTQTRNNVNILSPTGPKADRVVETSPDDFGSHPPYEKKKDTLFSASFGPQVNENPGFSPRSNTQATPSDHEASASITSFDNELANDKDYEEQPSSIARPIIDERVDEYLFPSIDLLEPGEDIDYDQFKEEIDEQGRELERVCMTFGVELKVVNAQTGPVLTLYEVELKEGLRIQKLERLTNDLAVKLKAEHVRIVSPIPGKNTVGVEVPNPSRQTVRLREVIEACAAEAENMDLPIFLGKDVVGNPMVADLAALPHLLVAGRTGTGKSVCLNTIIMSILMTRSPKQCKLIMIDPKMVELSPYKAIPHMMHPVVTDMEKAEAILEWAVDKMESRYRIFAQVGARKLSEFNKMTLETMRKRLRPKSEAEWFDFPKSMPSIVIVADEMADLIMTAGKDVENHIIRLAQKSRAVGIHLVLATQKPTVDVITGLIKSNLPARISFGVATQSDSRVVLDSKGAEQLLGNGDMLFLLPGTSQTLRGQGAFVSTREIDSVTDMIGVEEHQYDVVIETPQPQHNGEKNSVPDSDLDEHYCAAVELVIANGRASTSLLQRHFKIGYNRAARIIDMMEEAKVISPFNPAKPQQAREVIMTLAEWKGQQPDELEEKRNIEETLKTNEVSLPQKVAHEDELNSQTPDFVGASVVFESSTIPDRYGSVATSSTTCSRQTVQRTTSESIDLVVATNMVNDTARTSGKTFADRANSRASVRHEVFNQHSNVTNESRFELDERILNEIAPIEELDDDFADQFTETSLETSNKSQGWSDEQWKKYMEFDNFNDGDE